MHVLNKVFALIAARIGRATRGRFLSIAIAAIFCAAIAAPVQTSAFVRSARQLAADAMAAFQAGSAEVSRIGDTAIWITGSKVAPIVPEADASESVTILMLGVGLVVLVLTRRLRRRPQ